MLNLVLSATAFWWCTLDVKIHGQADHYLYFGRDSWHGEAPMHCSFDRESRTYKVRFEFKSLLSGFGANNTSQLEVKLTLWTRSPVADFYFYGAASGQHFGSQVNLQGRDASSEFSAQISPVAFPSVARSLSMGIVRIQKVESEW